MSVAETGDTLHRGGFVGTWTKGDKKLEREGEHYILELCYSGRRRPVQRSVGERG